MVGQIFIFYLGFMARQDYFNHFEPNQLLGGNNDTEIANNASPIHHHANHAPLNGI